MAVAEISMVRGKNSRQQQRALAADTYQPRVTNGCWEALRQQSSTVDSQVQVSKVLIESSVNGQLVVVMMINVKKMKR